MTALIFRGHEALGGIPVENRGLAYGDGVFETMRVDRGAVHWWDAHWTRLTGGAERLGLHMPDCGIARDACRSLFADESDGVLKLLLTRGGEGRGYAPAPDAPPVWMVSRHALPARTRRGLALHWAETRVAVQPLLAGLKHCNRLEQVMARGECARRGTDEALMCDVDGHVIGATAANVFLLADGRWCTPRVDRSGVAGVCRDHLLSVLDASEDSISMADVEGADAVFLCNAVRGILPVARLGARTWLDLSESVAVARRLAHRHPGLVLDLEHP
ncbi:MAG TPA: aminodeoxychorismate lyase [Luteimonas sp.]|nr:aminodeoxychorismate lyase [Luteimonas sp.]